MHQLLGGKRLREQVARCTGHRDEQLGVEDDLAGSAVMDRDLHAGEVDEELLAGAVHLTHDDVHVCPEGPVVVDELGVAIAVGVGLAVFEPQQLEGHPLSPQLSVHVGEVRHRPGDVGGRRRREQQLLEVVVGELLGQRPGQPGRDGAPDVIADGGERELEGEPDLAEREPLAEGEADDVADLAHGDAGSWHVHSSDTTVRGALRAGLHHASGCVSPFTRCTKTPKQVYGFDRNGCTNSTGIRR